jgi:hypothetical protein
MAKPRPVLRKFTDGREVCDLLGRAGRDEYMGRIKTMWLRQGKVCCLCRQKLALRDATFEHQDGRGMSGGHRDDRIEIDGKPYNGAAHWKCNREKGSQRVDYTDFYFTP